MKQMKQMKQYVVDAFSQQVFGGNQAAVCIVDQWPADATMQDIAKENRFSETAFIMKEGEGWRLRWFTPGGEIDLCGHATLASAFVVLNHLEPEVQSVAFDTMSGVLEVVRKGDLLQMDFPAYELAAVDVTDAMEDALGVRPLEAYMGRDLLCVLETEEQVRTLEPDQEKLLGIDGLLCHVTAPGHDGIDCVSRSFAPKLAIEEDPVCGSGHCHMFPFWAQRLGKSELVGYQASERGGTLYGTVENGRVALAGYAALFSECTIYVD